MSTARVEPCVSVSVVIAVRNEARFIRRLMCSILNQDYPSERTQIIVADGDSADGTREILESMAAQDPRITVVDNPQRIVSTGLNAAIAKATGDVVVRVDGHALVAPDFIRESVAALAHHPEAWAVGGPIRHTAATAFGWAVAEAMSHPVGVGNARHRFAAFEGYVDSVQFPAFRRWVFAKVGTFDPALVRNQDDELSFRIQQAGGRMFVTPRIRYQYFVRERPEQLFKQYFQYGFWRIPVILKHGRPTTLRQLAPLLFFALCAAGGLVGLWLARPVWALALPALYVTALVFAGLSRAPRHGLQMAILLPIAIATMHFGYAAGLAYGLVARMFGARSWDSAGRMATLSR